MQTDQLTIKRFEFNMFSENCYVVSDHTAQAVIIDAGCYFPQEQQALEDYITGHGLQVTHLLNTHLHLDHVFGNPFVKRRFGLSAEASHLDRPLLEKLSEQCRMFGFEPNEAPVAPGADLHDGDIIRFGESELHAIHLPGHSPGGMAFYHPSGGSLFSGDSLFCGSIGRTDLEGGDYHTLIQSLRTRLLTLPDETTVYPGHGPQTRIGVEKRQNSYLQ